MPAVISTTPRDDRVLRGDFEPPDRVLMVYTQSWPRALEDIAAQVLESGTRLSLVLEQDSSRARLDRLVRKLGQRHGDRVENLADVVDTPWVRDWGPLQLRASGGALWLDADYDDSERTSDDAAPQWLAQRQQIALAELPWALDGGAFVSNGAGLCVLTFEYLEVQGIGWDDGDLARMLSLLGCRTTALVPTLVAEQTKHADMIAQFVSPTHLLLTQIIDDSGGASEDARRMQAVELGVRRAAAQHGVAIDITHVPTPPTARWQNPRSYVNGLRLADRYLMPSYPRLGEPWESGARAALQSAMPSVTIVSLDTSEMIGAGGAIHCAALGLHLD